MSCAKKVDGKRDKSQVSTIVAGPPASLALILKVFSDLGGRASLRYLAVPIRKGVSRENSAGGGGGCSISKLSTASELF